MHGAATCLRLLLLFSEKFPVSLSPLGSLTSTQPPASLLQPKCHSDHLLATEQLPPPMQTPPCLRSLHFTAGGPPSIEGQPPPPSTAGLPSTLRPSYMSYILAPLSVSLHPTLPPGRSAAAVHPPPSIVAPYGFGHSAYGVYLVAYSVFSAEIGHC